MDNNLIATTSSDLLIKIWRISDGFNLKTLYEQAAIVLLFYFLKLI
jgi:hypothetical protein